MTTEERITKAKVNLIINNAFFGQLVGYLIPVESKVIPTMGVDILGNFYYNKGFVDKLNDNQLKAVLMHEIMHLAYQHPMRCGEKDPTIWNIAADLKINNDLMLAGERDLPQGGVVPNSEDQLVVDDKVLIDKISEKATEEIYDIIQKRFAKNQITVSFSADGKANVNGQGLSQSEKKMLERAVNDLLKSQDKQATKGEAQEQAKIWQERVATALQAGRNRGNVPAGLQRELDKLENPEIPWQQVLRERFNRIAHKRSWKKVNKRLLPNYFSGKTKTNTIKAFIAIDTSGSVSQAELSKFISEIYGITKSFTKFKFYIATCDTHLYDVQEFSDVTKNKIASLSIKGGGGTSFVPVFEYIDKKLKNSIDCLIYFTDGYGEYPEKKSPYHTYWILNSDYEDVPFGTKHKFEINK